MAVGTVGTLARAERDGSTGRWGASCRGWESRQVSPAALLLTQPPARLRDDTWPGWTNLGRPRVGDATGGWLGDSEPEPELSSSSEIHR